MPTAGVPCFFFNDTATTEIYTLSLHDALPISAIARSRSTTSPRRSRSSRAPRATRSSAADRKSTRLNSSHANISYAVFCLKKNNNLDEVQLVVRRRFHAHEFVAVLVQVLIGRQ